jgi:YVTN family beta-propeller protein
MARRRRVLLIALLLVLLGVGECSWLVYGQGPSYGLRTVTVGRMPGQVVIDAATDRVFVNNYQDQSVSVLSAGSGEVLRTVPLGASLGASIAGLVVDVPTNRVFVINDDFPLNIMLDAASGANVGRMVAPVFTVAVDPRTGRLFGTLGAAWSAGATAVTMVDGRNGAQLRIVNLVGSTPLGLAVDARTDRVFAVNAGDNTASMLQASSGRPLRTVKVGPVPVAVAVDTQTGRVFIPNTGANTVSVLDARSGAVLRTITVPPHPAAAVVDERTDRVFVVHGRSTTEGDYSAIAAVPTFPQAGAVGVTMLDARTGAVLRTLPVGGSVGDDHVGWAPVTNMAVEARRGRVYVINRVDPGSDGNGSVSVLDAQSGDLLHTVAVGRHPISLAVDEATARLFVVNTNAGCLHRSSLWDRVPAAVRQVLPFLPAPSRPTCYMPGTVTVIDTSRL